VKWQELWKLVSRAIGNQPVQTTSASFADVTGCVEKCAPDVDATAPSAYLTGTSENTSETPERTSASFADGPAPLARRMVESGEPFADGTRLAANQAIPSEQYLDRLGDDDRDRGAPQPHFSGAEDMYAKDAEAGTENGSVIASAPARAADGTAAEAAPAEDELEREFVGESADEWQARLINTTLAKYGLLGQPGTITAAMVKQGREAQRQRWMA